MINSKQENNFPFHSFANSKVDQIFSSKNQKICAPDDIVFHSYNSSKSLKTLLHLILYLKMRVQNNAPVLQRNLNTSSFYQLQQQAIQV